MRFNIDDRVRIKEYPGAEYSGLTGTIVGFDEVLDYPKYTEFFIVLLDKPVSRDRAFVLADYSLERINE